MARRHRKINEVGAKGVGDSSAGSGFQKANGQPAETRRTRILKHPRMKSLPSCVVQHTAILLV